MTHVSHMYPTTGIQHQHQMVTKHPQALVSVSIGVPLLKSLFLKFVYAQTSENGLTVHSFILLAFLNPVYAFPFHFL